MLDVNVTVKCELPPPCPSNDVGLNDSVTVIGYQGATWSGETRCCWGDETAGDAALPAPPAHAETAMPSVTATANNADPDR